MLCNSDSDSDSEVVISPAVLGTKNDYAGEGKQQFN
jgi:hypothetical protein